MKKITLIDAQYKKEKQKNPANSEYFTLRYWQSGTYYYMKDSWYNTIVAPTGSGKTIAIEALIWNFLKTNSGYKTIITVPQNSIGLGYGNNKFIVGKEKVSITIPKRNFRIHSKSNVDRIKDFLKEEVDDEDINSRILVCTHASIVELYKKLSPAQFKKLFKKCQLWVDESHHIRTTIVENDYEFNRLSEVIHSFIQNEYSVGIITATFFRGDGHGFLKEEYKKKFLSYRHTYEDYFNYDCNVLKGVKLHIALYENNIYEAVYDIYKKSQVPTIIYLPYVNSTMCGRDCKATRVKKLTKILKTINKDIKIVDLVNPKTQKENSKYIHEQNKIAKKFLSGESKEKPTIDVIIALNIFKEGSDYLPLENVIIMGKHNSTVEVMQRTGRSLRDYIGKKEANVYAILPGYSRKITNEEEVENIVNENFKFFNLVMTLNDIFYPSIKEIRNKEIDPELRGRLYNTVWEKYFGETYRDIKKGILDDIPYVVSDGLSPREQWEELERHCSRLLEEKGVHSKKDRAKMFQTLQANFIVANLLFDSSRKFEKISLDLIEKISPHDNYLLFTSKAFNIRTVTEFKKSVIDSSVYIKDVNIANIYAYILTKYAGFEKQKDYIHFKKNFDYKKINKYEEIKKLNNLISTTKDFENRVDYFKLEEKLEKLSKKDILNMSVLLPSDVFNFYNLKNLKMSLTSFFFCKKLVTPQDYLEKKIYTKLLNLKKFYDRYGRYPQESSKEKYERSLAFILNNIRKYKENPKFELWCKELNLWDRYYKNRYPTINQYDLKGNIIKIWKDTSITQIALELGLNNIAGVFQCLKGYPGHTQAYGSVWRYENDPFNKYKVPTKKVSASFLEWQEYCKAHKINTSIDWINHRKIRDLSMPYAPSVTYKITKDWPKGGWGEALGSDIRHPIVNIPEKDIKMIVSKKATSISIANKYNCSISSISRRVEKYKIKYKIKKN